MPPAKPKTSAVDIETVHAFADCMAGRFRPSVRRLLAMDYRSSAYRSSLQSLTTVGNRCAPFAVGRLRSAGVLLAGAFAEQLLPEALGGSRLSERVAYDPSRPPVPARDEGEYLGLCAVRTMPEEVAALLATKPAGDEEKLATGKILPRLGPCIRAGAAARLNIAGLRAILALAAYRLASQREGAR
jgi:hypothetical protein